ncbi:MAG: hypothetical protein CVV03_00615 [Firmicutes bacterium HGW-Firmicutes-8]|nr:MAG: hypothetical protein CVV03_00615 [Firmicutes bacterium HGW-Firmicutes-8]
MIIKKALVQTGICNPRDFRNLAISLQISDGMRNSFASSCRYFVWLKEKIICSVKRLPDNGIFNLDDIIQTQKFFIKFSGFTAPEILGVYYGDDGNVYIMEEPIKSFRMLDDAVIRGDLLPREASSILEKLFQEVATQPSLEPDPALLNKEVDEFFAAADILSIPDKYVNYLKDVLKRDLGKIAGPVIRTTRDLIPRNILVSNGKPVIVDFDLSRRTHFLWIDVCRSIYYSKEVVWNQDYLKFIPEGVNPTLINLLFWLSEVRLQQLISPYAQFLKSIEPRRNTAMYYFQKLLGTDDGSTMTSSFTLEVPFVNDRDIPLTSTKNVLQLFWTKDDIFKEEDSVKLSLIDDGAFHEYKFSLSSIAISKLRLDPGNKPAFMEIKNIILDIGDTMSEVIEPLAHWSADNDFCGLLTGPGVVRLTGQELYRFICVDQDPQLLLNSFVIPKDFHQLNLRVIMRVDKKASLDLTKIMELELKSKEEELIEQNKALSGLKGKLAEKEKKLTEHSKELFRLQVELEQILNSRSWRITALLRWIGQILQKDN